MRVDPVLAAVNTQQKLGIAVAALLVVGWLAYLALHLRRREAPPIGSEVELAPNRKPYFDDEALEGPRLSKSLGWGLVLTAVSAVGLPLYWLDEPSRQAGASVGFDKRAAERGFTLFQPSDSPLPAGNVGHFGCGGCHGPTGEGGSVNFALADPLDPAKAPREVTWQAPALNTATLRYSDEQIRAVLVYGRPGTPMPAWGVLGGGPMNDQQIDDLLAYMKSIELKPAEAQKQAMEQYGTDGKALFEGFCARCHTKGFSYGEPEAMGGGAFGPSLLDGSTVRQFPNIEDHLAFVTEGAPGGTGAAQGRQYGVRGVLGYESGGMPFFGKMLTAEQIRAVVEYERSL